MAFPTSLDSFPTLVDNVDNILAQHPNNLATAITALEAKMGVDSSAVTSSADYKLRNLPAQDGNWNAGATRDLSAKTFTSVVAVGTAPLTVTSTTVVGNLNADMVDGLHIASLVQTTGIQTIAGVKTFSSLPVIPLTPLATTDAASKGYVDTAITSITQVGLGSWVAKSTGTTYQATTDGFIVFYANVDNGDDFIFYTDSSTPPTTVRQRLQTGSGTTAFMGSMCCPVKKNDYYLLTVSGAVGTSAYYFISLGS